MVEISGKKEIYFLIKMLFDIVSDLQVDYWKETFFQYD